MMKTLKFILGYMIAGALAAPAVFWVVLFLHDGRSELYQYDIIGAALYFFCPVFIFPGLWFDTFVAEGLFYQSMLKHSIMNMVLFGVLSTVVLFAYNIKDTYGYAVKVVFYCLLATGCCLTYGFPSFIYYCFFLFIFDHVTVVRTRRR